MKEFIVAATFFVITVVWQSKKLDEPLRLALCFMAGMLGFLAVTLSK